MKKRSLTFCILLTVWLTAGCGFDPAKVRQEQTAESEQVLLTDNMISGRREENAAPIIEEAGDSEELFNERQPEAMGNEEQADKKVRKGTSVYNQPSDDASVLGSVGQGETVTLIGQKEEGEWYKISYNGRVAYIPAEAIEAEADETALNTGTNAEDGAITVKPSAAKDSDSQTIAEQVSEDMPDSEETETPKRSPEPTESPAPTESPEPAESPAPTESSEPAESPAPAESPEPAESPAPTESPEPAESPAPAESPVPTELPEPIEMPVPADTDFTDSADTSAYGENFASAI